MVNFKVSKFENDLILKIADRAEPLYRKVGDKKMALVMDLTACHANGCNLRLDEMLKADDFNFAHDIYGIRRHIDRSTGKLGDCFLPRFAA